MTTPDLPRLKEGLTRVLARSDRRPVEIDIVARRSNPHESTSASEIVHCRLGDTPPLILLCKYGIRGSASTGASAHHGGVGYEGDIYRKVLAHTKCSVPKFYGSYHEPDTGRDWLVLEYLRQSQSVSKMVHQYPLSQAADWIGRFHALHECLGPCNAPFLTRYDRSHYRGWAQRTSSVMTSLYPEAPWIATICEAFGGKLADELSSQRTIIHGEYYPKNVLVHNGTVFPVDWESAAIAAGEIDLAAISEGWPGNDSLACEQRYVEARWQGKIPHAFESRLDAARLYLHLRWLGECPTKLADRKTGWRFELMHQCGRRLGIF